MNFPKLILFILEGTKNWLVSIYYVVYISLLLGTINYYISRGFGS